MATGRNLVQRVKQVSKVNGVPRELVQMQRNVERATEGARKNPDNDGRLVERVTIPASGELRIPHKMGRKPTSVSDRTKHSGTPGYTVTRMTSREIVITGVAAGELDLWVS